MIQNAAVFFDTNAYRDFFRKSHSAGVWTATNLRAHKQQKGIVAYATNVIEHTEVAG